MLTREQRTAVYIVLFLFLLGLAVKAWRAAHPSEQQVSVPVNENASR